MGNLYKSLENIKYVYYRRGIYVETLYMDRYFKNIRIRVPWRSTLNTTPSADHVPEIE